MCRRALFYREVQSLSSTFYEGRERLSESNCHRSAALPCVLQAHSGIDFLSLCPGNISVCTGQAALRSFACAPDSHLRSKVDTRAAVPLQWFVRQLSAWLKRQNPPE